MKSKKRRAARQDSTKRRAAKKPKPDRTKQQCSVCLKAGHNARRHKKGKRSK